MEEESVTVFSKSHHNPYWVVERTYPTTYAIMVLGLKLESGDTVTGDDNRLYAWFPLGTNPNE